jgi:hypothetical protein
LVIGPDNRKTPALQAHHQLENSRQRADRPWGGPLADGHAAAFIESFNGKLAVQLAGKSPAGWSKDWERFNMAVPQYVCGGFFTTVAGLTLLKFQRLT